jgi:hypothetical protein
MKRRKVTRIPHPIADAFAPEVIERDTIKLSNAEYQQLNQRGKSARAFLDSLSGTVEYAAQVAAFEELVGTDGRAVLGLLNRAYASVRTETGTRHFFVEWSWQDGDDNRFYTEADLTREESDDLEADLERRASTAGDIGHPLIGEYHPVYQNAAQLRKEISAALTDTCETCFASLDDEPDHKCP